MCLVLVRLVGQVPLRTEEQVLGYKDFPNEATYIHTNGSFFLTGVYLYYKIYCFEGEIGNLTTISKVVYIELVGKEGKPIFRHKILLDKGQGNGDFFIPTEVNSGSYKLIAYTNWMQNQDQEHYFQKNITIVNPYRTNEPELLKVPHIIKKDSIIGSGVDSLDISSIKDEVEPTDYGPVNVQTNGEYFPKRARVTLNLKSEEGVQSINGYYSISVRKRDLVQVLPYKGIGDIRLEKPKDGDGTVKMGDSIFLPELRGELVQGNVAALQTDKSVKNLKLAISIPGENPVLEIVRTNAQGNFQLNISKLYSGEKINAQVLSQNPEDYSISIKKPKDLNYQKFDFEEVKLDVSMREEILRRSIHNQVENSYFQFRPDSILTFSSKDFFKQKEAKTYVLDDYTRFSTFKETLVEIIQDVFSKRTAKDDFTIRVKGYDYSSVLDVPPLVLMDGCLIQDFNALLEFDARSINEVTVYRQGFVLGPQVYQGALFLKTQEGKGYELLQKNGSVSVLEWLKPLENKKYFVQRYDLQKKDKLPDDRLQLLWIPSLSITKNEVEIDFFTSDVAGAFEISIEGITEQNELVSIQRSFVVKD